MGCHMPTALARIAAQLLPEHISWPHSGALPRSAPGAPSCRESPPQRAENHPDTLQGIQDLWEDGPAVGAGSEAGIVPARTGEAAGMHPGLLESQGSGIEAAFWAI